MPIEQGAIAKAAGSYDAAKPWPIEGLTPGSWRLDPEGVAPVFCAEVAGVSRVGLASVVDGQLVVRMLSSTASPASLAVATQIAEGGMFARVATDDDGLVRGVALRTSKGPMVWLDEADVGTWSLTTPPSAREAELNGAPRLDALDAKDSGSRAADVGDGDCEHFDQTDHEQRTGDRMANHNEHERETNLDEIGEDDPVVQAQVAQLVRNHTQHCKTPEEREERLRQLRMDMGASAELAELGRAIRTDQRERDELELNLDEVGEDDPVVRAQVKEIQERTKTAPGYSKHHGFR